MVSSRGKRGSSSKATATSKKKKTAGRKAATVPIEKAISPNDSFEYFYGPVEDYAIILMDENGVITAWNRGAEIIKGYKAEEILGKNYRIFYTREDRETKLSDRLLEQARQQGKTTYEGWRVRKDGSRFWGSMSLTALKHRDGTINQFLKITRDLTAKKIAEDRVSNFLDELTFKNQELKKSEERYHKMVAEVKDYAIILLDVDGKVIEWNLGAEKLKGYTPKEIIGKNFRLFYPNEEKQRRLPEQLLAEAAKKGSVTHEGWRVKKNGERFWGGVAITALHDGEGNIIGYSKVTRDLTDRKIAEDRMSNIVEELKQANDYLRASEERYHKMIDEVQDYAIILLDTKGNVQDWNTGAKFIKGYTAEEIIGKSFREFYTKEDREKGLPDRLLETARQHRKVVHEGWRIRKDKSAFWGNVVITALHDAKGKIIGFSKVTRDLTERKRADDALRNSAAQMDLKNKTLERLNAEVSSFAYVASHDLKEPLRKIQAFADRIKEGAALSERNHEYLSKIVESAQRMQTLIQDLLSFSEVSNDNSALQNVDLNKVLLTVKNDLEISIQEKKGVVKAGKLPVLRGVPHQFNQLFANLISNSLKYAKKDELPVITIACEIISGPDIPGEVSKEANSYYHITFKDNGIGFDQEFSEKIFQAFQRLHTRTEFSGTGVGLAIVKAIVHNHNGIIHAKSKRGVGSTFHIYLPVNAEQ